MTGEHVLHLTDTDYTYDHRVRHAFEVLHPGGKIEIIPKHHKKIDLFIAGVIIFVILPFALLFGAPAERILRRRGIPSVGFFLGSKRLHKDMARSICFLRRSRKEIKRCKLLYCNDQRCGIVGLLANLIHGVSYIYDAHEMVPFRNRSYGVMRRSIEGALEKMIMKRSVANYVVNVPIKRIYVKHHRQKNISVRNNDFYPDHGVVRDTGWVAPCIIYVGAAEGRKMELLGEFAERADCQLIMAVDHPSALFLNGADISGLDNYQTFIAEKVIGKSPYMWCVLDKNILSYKFSLPNKFFQALAFGVPIIASPETYVGHIVRRHGIGVIWKEGDPIIRDVLWSNERYAAYTENVRKLRKQLRETRMTL